MSAAEAYVRASLLRQLEIYPSESGAPVSVDAPVVIDLTGRTTIASSGSLGNDLIVDVSHAPSPQGIFRTAEALVGRTTRAKTFYGTLTREYEVRNESPYFGFGRVSGSPFEELHTSRIEAAHNWLVRAHKLHIARAHTEILERLTNLLNEVAESSEADVPTRQSLDSAVEFFSGRADLTDPMLSVTPSGNVWAEWVSAGNRRAALEFLGNGSVNLVAIFPDLQRRWRKDSIAANLSKSAVSDQIDQNTELHWMIAGRG